MIPKTLSLFILLTVTWSDFAVAAKAPRRVCTQILTGGEKFSVYQEHAPRIGRVTYANTSPMHATIAAVQEHLARARAKSAGGALLRVSPVTPFAAMAIDRVDDYLVHPSLTAAYALFEGGDLAEVDAAILDIDLPLYTDRAGDPGPRLTEMLNRVRGRLIEGLESGWTAERTRAAVVRILEDALERDFARAESFLHVSSFENSFAFEANGSAIARLVATFVTRRAPLRITTPDGRVARVVGYRRTIGDERATDLILRDVNPRPLASGLTRVVPVGTFPPGSTLVHHDVQSRIVRRADALELSLERTVATEAVQE